MAPITVCTVVDSSLINNQQHKQSTFGIRCGFLHGKRHWHLIFQPERDFSQAGLFLSTNASTLHPQKVEVRMFCRQNRAYRPNKDTPGTKTEDHSENAALGVPVPILKRAAVARYAPSWAPADETDLE